MKSLVLLQTDTCYKNHNIIKDRVSKTIKSIYFTLKKKQSLVSLVMSGDSQLYIHVAL